MGELATLWVSVLAGEEGGCDALVGDGGCGVRGGTELREVFGGEEDDHGRGDRIQGSQAGKCEHFNGIDRREVDAFSRGRNVGVICIGKVNSLVLDATKVLDRRKAISGVMLGLILHALRKRERVRR